MSDLRKVGTIPLSGYCPERFRKPSGTAKGFLSSTHKMPEISIHFGI